jgi:hypothetical protein
MRFIKHQHWLKDGISSLCTMQLVWVEVNVEALNFKGFP